MKCNKNRNFDEPLKILLCMTSVRQKFETCLDDSYTKMKMKVVLKKCPILSVKQKIFQRSLTDTMLLKDTFRAALTSNIDA